MTVTRGESFFGSDVKLETQEQRLGPLQAIDGAWHASEGDIADAALRIIRARVYMA